MLIWLQYFRAFFIFIFEESCFRTFYYQVSWCHQSDNSTEMMQTLLIRHNVFAGCLPCAAAFCHINSITSFRLWNVDEIKEAGVIWLPFKISYSFLLFPVINVAVWGCRGATQWEKHLKLNAHILHTKINLYKRHFLISDHQFLFSLIKSNFKELLNELKWPTALKVLGVFLTEVQSTDISVKCTPPNLAAFRTHCKGVCFEKLNFTFLFISDWLNPIDSSDESNQAAHHC